MKQNSGFTLIQISIILTVASLIFVATLPGVQTSLKANQASVTKMHSILNTMRGYMAANGYLPCPADPTQAIGASNYGVAAANSGATNNCIGSTPAAAYADTTNHIAIGMLPVKSLGLSYADALDGQGRDITYAVDTNATAACWSASSLAGAITVNDNGVNYNTIAVLVSHGADGYGAWLPLSGSSGTASRYDNGSTDTAQADNAQVAHGGGLTANTTFASFINKAATSTFDDNLVYKNNLYTLNTLPTSAQVYPSITPPANATYVTGNVLTFTLAYTSNVTVTGTPRLILSALGSGSIGTSNKAYANYASGSGTNTLTFSYTVQAGDSAPTSGLSMISSVDLNGGNISGGSLCFAAPSLSAVLISSVAYVYVGDSSHNRVVILSTTGTFIRQIGCASGPCSSGSGNTQFNSPRKVVIDSHGNIFVTDSGNNKVKKFDSSGNYISYFDGSPSHTLSSPEGMAIDGSDNIWVSSPGNAYIEKFDNTGTYVGEFGGTAGASTPGDFNATNGAEGVALDTSGNIWVSVYNPYWMQEFSVTSPYSYIKNIGTLGSGSGQLKAAHSIAIDSSNNIYLPDPVNERIEKFNASTGAAVNSFSGGTLPYFSGHTAFSNPISVAIDTSNNIWVVDKTANNIQEFTSAGVWIQTITTFNSGDTFNTPHGITVGR